MGAAEKAGRGVVAIVAAQEFQWVFSATKKRLDWQGVVFLDWAKDRAPGQLHYYFYLLTAKCPLGPGFIKVCTYFPYPAKVWLNGHEWAERQARRGLRPHLTELANGFATCERSSQRLQPICDRLYFRPTSNSLLRAPDFSQVLSSLTLLKTVDAG